MKEFWSFLRSVKLGVSLLAILGIVSIFGTLLPAAESLHYVFHSWWYTGLLLLVAINVSVASWHTLTVTAPAEAKTWFLHGQKAFEGLPLRREFDLPSPTSNETEGRLERVAGELRVLGYRVSREGDAVCAIAGMQSRAGAFVSHAGLLAIVAGALVQAFFGVRGALELTEGDSTAFFTRLDLPEDDREAARQPLGAELTLCDFEVYIHPQSGIPGKFVSHILIEENGKTRPGAVEVNHTETVGGFVLHQQSYQPVTGLRRYLVAFDLPASNGSPRRLAEEINVGERATLDTSDTLELLQKDSSVVARVNAADGSMRDFPIEEIAPGEAESPRHAESSAAIADDGSSTFSAELIRFVPNLTVQGDRVESLNDEWNNPAIQVAIYRDGTPFGSAWLFYKPEFRDFVMGPKLPCRLTCVRLLPAGVPESPPPKNADLKDLRPLVEARNGKGDLLAALELRAGERVVIPRQELGTAAAASAKQEEASSHQTSAEDLPSTAGQAARYSLAGFERVQAYQTILGVTRNPGIGAIYIGCFLFSIGPIVAFCARRRRIFASVDRKTGRFYLGGRAQRAVGVLARDFDRAARAVGFDGSGH